MADGDGVPRGPRTYRHRLRTLGPVAPLLPAAALVVLSKAILDDHASITRTALSVLLAVVALPTLLLLGVPLMSGTGTLALAVLLSVVLWVALGSVAALRATRRPAVAWREFWMELGWLVAAVWTGLVVGVVAANLVLGRPLL